MAEDRKRLRDVDQSASDVGKAGPLVVQRPRTTVGMQTLPPQDNRPMNADRGVGKIGFDHVWNTLQGRDVTPGSTGTVVSETWVYTPRFQGLGDSRIIGEMVTSGVVSLSTKLYGNNLSVAIASGTRLAAVFQRATVTPAIMTQTPYTASLTYMASATQTTNVNMLGGRLQTAIVGRLQMPFGATIRACTTGTLNYALVSAFQQVSGILYPDCGLNGTKRFFPINDAIAAPPYSFFVYPEPWFPSGAFNITYPTNIQLVPLPDGYVPSPTQIPTVEGLPPNCSAYMLLLGYSLTQGPYLRWVNQCPQHDTTPSEFLMDYVWLGTLVTNNNDEPMEGARSNVTLYFKTTPNMRVTCFEMLRENVIYVTAMGMAVLPEQSTVTDMQLQPVPPDVLHSSYEAVAAFNASDDGRRTWSTYPTQF